MAMHLGRPRRAGERYPGGDIRHAVAAARGAVAAEDLDAAIVKAALAQGWTERRAGGHGPL
jgi:hypothetical protein